jgi:hypothetical protein
MPKDVRLAQATTNNVGDIVEFCSWLETKSLKPFRSDRTPKAHREPSSHALYSAPATRSAGAVSMPTMQSKMAAEVEKGREGGPTH